MSFFKYKAFGSDGKPATGLVEAPTQDQAVKLLKEKNLFVVSVETSQGQLGTQMINRLQKVGFGDIVNFTRQMSTMVTAGLSLPESLTILQAQTKNEVMSRMLSDIQRQIVGGGTLASALSKYPQYFSNIYIALVKAGEASGMLDKVLLRLAESLESQRELRGKVTGALIYPAIIVIGMIGVVMVMMVVVVPKLTDLYKDFGLDLPMTTQILIGMSNFMVRFWWLVIVGAVGLAYGFAAWRKTKTGEYMLDVLILKIPLLGNLKTKMVLVEFTRTLAMLIGAGIHILDALHIIRDALDSVVFRLAIDDVARKVEKGFTLADTFGSHPEFPPIVSQMMKVGEETGKLDDTMLKLSTYFQSETEGLVKGLTTAMEPIIMVVLGLGVGFIVISIITPIYNLSGQIK